MLFRSWWRWLGVRAGASRAAAVLVGRSADVRVGESPAEQWRRWIDRVNDLRKYHSARRSGLQI